MLMMNHCAKGSFSFIKDLKSGNFQNSFTVPLDVETLFDNAPLAELVNLAVELILSCHKNLKSNKD